MGMAQVPSCACISHNECLLIVVYTVWGDTTLYLASTAYMHLENQNDAMHSIFEINR